MSSRSSPLKSWPRIACAQYSALRCGQRSAGAPAKALAGIGKKGYDAAKLKTHPAFKKLSADEQKAVEEYLKKL